MKKIALITGTSTGLGLETSILLAENGFKVYASMRDLSKSDKLRDRSKEMDLNIELIHLDVCDTVSIQSAVDTIIEREEKIDLLINNAGAGFAKTTENASFQEIDWVTDLNYTGVVRTVKCVLPHMRKQRSGHIINITSVGGLVGQPFNELYCAAKFAVEGYTEALATYLTDPFGIKFSLVEPGGIVSEFLKSATAKTFDSVDDDDRTDEYDPIFQRYIDGSKRRAATGETQAYQTAEEVAEVILQVAEAETPPLRVRTSEWAENFCNLKTGLDPDGVKQVTTIKRDFL